MSVWTFLLRSLRYYWRQHLGLLAGVVLSAAVLCGALIVGDSVRYSLRRQVDLRLGDTGFSLQKQTGSFPENLRNDMAHKLSVNIAGILQQRGVAARPDGSAVSGQITIAGVNETFFQLFNAPPIWLKDNIVAINPLLADSLKVGVGDTLTIRLPDPLRLPGDMGLQGGEKKISLSVSVGQIAPMDTFGRFSLMSEQVAPATLFISLPYLQNKLGLDGQLNTLLVAQHKHDGTLLHKDIVDRALRQSFRLTDCGIEASHQHEQICIKSRDVFIAQPVAKAVQEVTAGKAGKAFTYFVNRITHQKNQTPYSFISGVDITGYPHPERGHIVLADWLASDLDVKKMGESVTLSYYVLNDDGGLVEQEKQFTVSAIIPAASVKPDLIEPDFPGFKDAGSCSEWDPDLPVDLSKIRDKDEAYWKEFKTAPKAFVNFADAQEMWANRYGAMTSLVIPAADKSVDDIKAEIVQHIVPETMGFVFAATRKDGVAASANGVDFGGLFIGLSFFIILSAVMLSALFFVFGINSRAKQAGTLYAVGFSSHLVKRLFLLEGGILAFAGSLLGAFAGVLYAFIVIHFLQSYWQGAVGQTLLWLDARPVTLCMGAAISFAVSMVSILIVLRGFHGHRSLCSLQANVVCRAKPITFPLIFSALCVAGGIVVTLWSGLQSTNVGAFFGAGSLLLVGGIVLSIASLRYLENLRQFRGVCGLIFKGVSRNAGRSVAALGALACGVFCVVSVGVNRSDPSAGAFEKKSGTGGYALYMQSTLPLPYDLNNPRVLGKLMGDSPELRDIHITPMRIRMGNDASCLNLNRVTHPPLLGVDVAGFIRRDAFTFVSFADGVDVLKRWALLAAVADRNVIPAIADQAVIQWGLGKKVGDEIEYVDESGNPFTIKLVAGIANSVFQGKILISEKHLLEKYPSLVGANVFLIDTKQPAQLQPVLQRRLQDYGVRVEPAVQRLAMFATVENTYLSIFLALGGLGLLIGTAGVGVLLLRNALERRSELAMLRSVGYSRKTIFRILAYEHLLLIFWGCALGLFASLPVALPAIINAPAQLPYGLLAGCLVVLGMSSILFTMLAARAALSGKVLDALRTE